MDHLLDEPRRVTALLVAGLLTTAALLYLWWPLGTVVGGTAGVLAVARIGLAMQAAANEQFAVGELELDDLAQSPEDDVRSDLERLKEQLGDDYPDFARAARLVVSTQYASAARLQRELGLPYSRARRLLSDLEQQHFVGPATGSLPRQVLLPKERLPELEQLLGQA
jgi:DNA segregation ATPase FtsK/SpoIIIE-like protein